jgi:hypothetical protein
MFNDNKYTRWYYQIINRAQSRRLPNDCYIEKRKCVGSKNGRFGYKMSAEEIAQRTATLKKNKLAKKLAQEN